MMWKVNPLSATPSIQSLMFFLFFLKYMYIMVPEIVIAPMSDQ